MEIRKTRPEDLSQVMAIYEAARKFMCETGNPTQWAGGYPAEALVRDDIENGCSYVAIENGEPETVFMFRRGDDPTYHVIENGGWLNDDPYAVIHRIASMGRVKGSGSRCIRWCFEQYPNLRIDTHDDNRVMRHVLEKNGFVKCGRIYTEDGSPRIAFQKTGSQNLRGGTGYGTGSNFPSAQTD